MADIFCGKILHSPSVGSKSPLCVYSSPCTVSYYLNVSIFHCNPHRHSRRCYLLHDRRYLASASSSNRLPSELDIISTAERSDGSVVFKFADASQIVKDVEHLDESEEKLSEETADRRRGADFVGDDTGLKNCSSNSVELAYDDSDQEHSEAVKSDAVEGEGAVDANSESNADVGEDNSMPEFAVSVVKATKISTYSELAQYGGNQEHSEVVESDNVAGRGAMDVKNEPNEKVDQGIGSLELAVSLVGTSRDSEVELAHNDSDRDHSEMVEGNSGMGRGAMDINNELAVSAVEAEGTSSAFEIELVRNESHLPSEIAESNDGAAKGSMDVKNELDEYTDPNTQISESVVSVVEAEETSVDSSVGLMSAHNFTEGSSGSGENRKADVSLTNILEDVEKSHRPDLNDHIYVAASSDDSVLEDAEVFCSEEASEDITGVQAIMPVASSSDELSAERLGCNESLDGGEQNSSVDTGADMSFLVKDDEADNVTAIMSEHSQSVVGLIPDLESITSDKSQCLVADNSSDILPRKSDVAAEISEFTERSAHKDLGTKSVESTISRGDGHLSDSILHSAAASLRNPSKELGSNRKIGSAKMCSGLYFFQPTKSIVAATSLSSRQYDTTFCHSNSSVNIDSEIMMWHYRLGHPNFLYLRKLFPNLFIDKNPRSFDCEICQLAKHTRSVYLGIPYQPSKPFALVHSDIWGPSRVKNINGARWFVTFVDDHTRLTWVFLMKEKSELTRIFQTFNSMIQNQFGTNIKILRFDNAREYFYSVLGDYLSKHGIVQVSSCVNTPQQNGVAERKNRQLLEVARAIMFSTNVPKYLWGEAVLTSAYLINRLPSRVLQFKTPRNVLINFFPHAQFLSSNLPPKVFGCSAFVHVYSQSRSKLDPQSTKCVFIGYPTHKKGYKCFCPITRKMFETMDVTFFENSPYYSNLEIQGENTTNFQPWCWDSILEHNSEFIPSQSISQKQPLSPTCGSIPSTLDQPSLPTCSKQPIPQSTTKELLVYSRKNRQTQELVEPNTHLTPV